MTSFAFIFGTLPLAIATGAGAGARQSLGNTVVFGMLVATLIGILVIPVFYVVIQRISERNRRSAATRRPAPGGFVDRNAGGRCMNAFLFVADRAARSAPARWGRPNQRPTSTCRSISRPERGARREVAGRPAMVGALPRSGARRIDQNRAHAELRRADRACAGRGVPRAGRRRRSRLDSAGGGRRQRQPLAHLDGGAESAAFQCETGASTYNAEIDVAYEVDLWGRIASIQDAARADFLASEFARDTTRVSVISSVAATYFALRALDQQLAVSERTLAGREKFLDLTRAQF